MTFSHPSYVRLPQESWRHQVNSTRVVIVVVRGEAVSLRHLCTSILLVLLLLPARQASAQTKPPLRFPESRSYSPGEIWLAWNQSERIGFVRGFILGHEEGYRLACTGDALCLNKQHLFKKDLSQYEQCITEFYDRHSGDRDVPFRVLLMQADRRTADELHEWLLRKK